MSTHQQKVRDCLALNYPVQDIIKDRYYAEVAPTLGLCVYSLVVSGQPDYIGQLFPIPLSATRSNLEDCFVRFTMALASQAGATFHNTRQKYRYFHADDLLTLQCLIHEAEANWREFDAIQARNPDAAAGKVLV